MAGITTNQDTAPDDDKFLPQHLTVQLLETLAKIIPSPTHTEISNLDADGQKFIAAHKKPDLFTPLTYKLFWREDPTELLDAYTGSLNELDKFGHSALTIAIANEDFVLAEKLIQKGAIVFLEDKIVLEIALTSMLQRDPNITDQILASINNNADWAREYLTYLKDYITGNTNSKTHKYRDVFNPTIRYFGQVLDTMVYFNGTPSHYGFIRPSLNLLAAHLDSFYKGLQAAPEQQAFKPIADAFAFIKSTSNFVGNIPADNAAETIANQINNNLSKNLKEPVIVLGGCAGNSIAVAFIHNTMILSNLGMGGDPQHGTAIYAIKNQAKITTPMIKTFLGGLGNATDPNIIFALLGEIVDPTPLYTINQNLTPIDNCIFVNPRAIIQGMLLVLETMQKSQNITKDSLTANASTAESAYKAYMNSLYQSSAEDLAKFMRNNELLRNRRVECCSLALKYINQHYMEPEAIGRCIELRNALEFVGLKGFCINNILPEAKVALQNYTITQQENTAIRIIEQEGKK